MGISEDVRRNKLLEGQESISEFNKQENLTSRMLMVELLIEIKIMNSHLEILTGKKIEEHDLKGKR